MRALLFASLLSLGQPAERIADIQVHGNTITETARVIELAGAQVGAPFTERTIADVQARLEAAHAFERVEVLKRFASIADPSQIALVIVLDEGRVAVMGEGTPDPGAIVKRRGLDLMAMPIVGYEDGYGMVYGGQLSWPNALGNGRRVSFPLTWGGDKRAAAELEVPLRGPVSRLKGGAALSRREHPFFDDDVNRRRAWGRVERDAGRAIRLGATAAIESVGLFDARDRYGELGVDATVDTRIDPFLPGNALYARAAWSRLQFHRAADAGRSELDARVYLVAPSNSVFVVRGFVQTSTVSLPAAIKPMLGGAANLRGFAAGSEIGDTLVATSAEWRVPLNSPLSLGKVGVSAFADVAAVYDKGERLPDQRFSRGVGGSLWLSAAVFRANIAVARGLGRGTRVHFTLSSSF